MDQTYDSGSVAAAAAIFGIVMIPALIVTVILVIAHWKIYEKAGKPGWAAIIPIYNVIVLLEIVGKPVWWFLLIAFPCTAPIFAIWAINLLSKSFGQSEGFTVGLLFLPFIFYPMLAFGNYQYVGPAGAGFAGAKGFDPSVGYKDPFNNPPQA
ncbi:DUF5684 domain-containing protein [Mucilaginibacter pedocola]|uniref:Signal peptidase I n=1 Tax=Mucilaginibacter pedocola TaxID=1792845 RepID=A0A1S9PC11_9SPHI|nr:DUF5684 domain-containing protein [Mucilaginibacter pedocola]OOQ58469.1 hypothetical protein BC343_07295 [Mucilaginibacter pedocola]